MGDINHKTITTPPINQPSRRKMEQCVIDLDKQFFQRTIANIFLTIIFNIWFGCSKEPSHGDGSFEYPQHMIWLRNKKIFFGDDTFISSSRESISKYNI